MFTPSLLPLRLRFTIGFAAPGQVVCQVRVLLDPALGRGCSIHPRFPDKISAKIRRCHASEVQCVVRRVAPRNRSREYLFVLFLFTFRLLLKLGLLLCCAMTVWLLLLLPLSTKCNLPSMALSYDRPRHDKIVKSILFIILFVVLFFPNQNRAAWQ